MWTEYFNFIKLRRGRVITPSHGEIDFSADDIGIEICEELFENGFPYLELTELGKKELYPQASDLIEEIVPIPSISGISNQKEELSQKKDKNKESRKCDQ